MSADILCDKYMYQMAQDTNTPARCDVMIKGTGEGGSKTGVGQNRVIYCF